MQKNTFYNTFSRRGSVLLEMIVVIGVIGVIAGTIGGIFYANQRGSEIGRQATLETSLAQEAIEALKVVAVANDGTSQGWNRIYCPPDQVEPDEGGDCTTAGAKGTATDYRVEAVGNIWKLFKGSEAVSLSSETYTRAINIENVCRSDTDNSITGVMPCGGGSSEDPLTQKLTVKITPPNGAQFTSATYIARVLNKQSSPATAPAVQSDWSGGEVGDTPTCATVTTSFGTTYCADDNNADVTGTAGSIKILLQ